MDGSCVYQTTLVERCSHTRMSREDKHSALRASLISEEMVQLSFGMQEPANLEHKVRTKASSSRLVLAKGGCRVSQ